MAVQTKYSPSQLHAGSKLPACAVNSTVIYCTHKVTTTSHSQARMGGEKGPRNEADVMPCSQALFGGEEEPGNEADFMPCSQSLMEGDRERMKLGLTLLLSTTHTDVAIPVW